MICDHLTSRMISISKKNAGPRNRTWVSSATTMCTDHYTRPAVYEFVRRNKYTYIVYHISLHRAL